MIHGDCSSRGCYAMTDEQIAEIYALARESFFGGQRAFQVQAYPFKMTPLNMAKHRNSPHMAFWRMIKEGYDHFEVTRQEPKVDVCEKRYVFDAAETTGKFTPAGKCPVFKVNEELVAAVKEKQQRDERQMAELVSRGTPTVPIRTGIDGGMNPWRHREPHRARELAARLDPGQYQAARRGRRPRAPTGSTHEPGLDRDRGRAGLPLAHPGGFGGLRQPVRRSVLLQRR